MFLNWQAAQEMGPVLSNWQWCGAVQLLHFLSLGGSLSFYPTESLKQSPLVLSLLETFPNSAQPIDWNICIFLFTLVCLLSNTTVFWWLSAVLAVSEQGVKSSISSG